MKGVRFFGAWPNGSEWPDGANGHLPILSSPDLLRLTASMASPTSTAAVALAAHVSSTPAAAPQVEAEDSESLSTKDAW